MNATTFAKVGAGVVGLLVAAKFSDKIQAAGKTALNGVTTVTKKAVSYVPFIGAKLPRRKASVTKATEAANAALDALEKCATKKEWTSFIDAVAARDAQHAAA